MLISPFPFCKVWSLSALLEFHVENSLGFFAMFAHSSGTELLIFLTLHLKPTEHVLDRQSADKAVGVSSEGALTMISFSKHFISYLTILSEVVN